MTKPRCAWVGDDVLYQNYHDTEWGVPLHNDAKLFELLILEGAQAGLSWITILRKRENYRAALDNFDAQKIARYPAEKIASLMQNSGIVRNRSCTKKHRAINCAPTGLTLSQNWADAMGL